MVQRVVFFCITIFWVTMKASEEMAVWIGVIHEGRLVAVGTPEELRRKNGQSGPLGKRF